MASADRNLLFGILALQMDFVGKDTLVAAMNAWVLDKAKPLGQILRERRVLAADEHDLVEALVRKHLERHGGDERQCLTALSSSRPPLPAELQAIPDAAVQGTLTHVGPARPDANGTIDHLPDPWTASAPPAPGRPAGRYRILRPHARGGLGEVSVAADTELPRHVALKEIQERFADDPASRTRFVQEGAITGGLEHPGIVPVYGLGAHADGRPFYAMRFVKGDNLKQAIQRFHENTTPCGVAGGTPPATPQAATTFHSLAFRQLLSRFINVCQTVAYAHSRGVVHRDLKPGNVMLGPYGETLVVDWGLAKPVGRSDPTAGPAEGTLRPEGGKGTVETIAGAVIGTPAYMSPEQAAGRTDELGPTSDVYSLGATLFALLTGRAPFEGDDPLDVLRRVQDGATVPPRAIRPGVPRALDAICAKAMGLRPADRYPTALALAADLERWLADEPVSAYRAGWAERAARGARRHKPLVAGAAVLLVVTAIGLALTTTLVRRQQQETQAEKERAETNFALARKAVEDTIARVVEDRRLKDAGFQETRRELLAAVIPFYEQFVHQREGDAGLERDRARAYVRLAQVRSEIGESAEAARDAAEACAVFDRLARQLPQRVDIRQEQALAHLDHGHLINRPGARPAAVAKWQAALHLQESLARDVPDNPAVRQELALTHLTLGNYYAHLREHGAAAEAYGRAIALQEDLARTAPNLRSARQELALSYQNLGNARRGASDWAGALAAYRRASALQDELSQGVVPSRSLRQESAITQLNLGRLWQACGAADEALTAFHTAIAAQERLLHDFPGVAAVRQELAHGYAHRGRLRATTGRLPEAAEDFRSARDLLLKLTADYPAVPSYTLDLCRCFCDLGDRDLLAGDRRGAERSYAEAAQRLGKLHDVTAPAGGPQPESPFARVASLWNRAAEHDDGPARADLQARAAWALVCAGRHSEALMAVDRLAEDADGEFLYQAARACAAGAAGSANDQDFQQYVNRILTLLRRAADRKHGEFVRLRQDPAFAPLRDRPAVMDRLTALLPKLVMRP